MNKYIKFILICGALLLLVSFLIVYGEYQARNIKIIALNKFGLNGILIKEDKNFEISGIFGDRGCEWIFTISMSEYEKYKKSIKSNKDVQRVNQFTQDHILYSFDVESNRYFNNLDIMTYDDDVQITINYNAYIKN